MRAPASVAALLALVAVLAAAAPASADDVWLWACHGPAGQPLGDLGDRAAAEGDPQGSRCDAPGGGLKAQAGTGWVFDMPSAATLREVRVNRTVALGAGETYTLRAATVLETGSAFNGGRTFGAAGSRVAFDVTCGGVCQPGEGATVSALAFRVSDAVKPAGAVAGWHSPAAGTLQLHVSGVDTGLGLQRAVAYIDDQPVGQASFGDPACADLSPGDGVLDVPFALVAQNDEDETHIPVGCVNRGQVVVPVSTAGLPDRPGYHVQVDLFDLAGNRTRVLDAVTEVKNTPPENISTRTLTIGSSGIGEPPPDQRGGGSGGGVGVAGDSASSCRSPQLSMALETKPLRTSRGVAVLLFGRPYRFAGRLTCVIGNRRRAAPKRIAIEVLTATGSRTTFRTRVRTGTNGRVALTLRFLASGRTRAGSSAAASALARRTVTFRFTGPDRRRSQVRINLRLQRLRAFPSSTSIYGHWFRFEVPSDRLRFDTLEGRNILAGSRLTVRCVGRGCPRTSIKSAAPRRRRSSVSLLGPLAGADLLPGSRLEVTLSKPGYRGIGKLYCVRAGQRVHTRSYSLDGRKPSC